MNGARKPAANSQSRFCRFVAGFRVFGLAEAVDRVFETDILASNA
jgi:hypothetical protein